jgi:dolichol-phosphate mannosyltransferase
MLSFALNTARPKSSAEICLSYIKVIMHNILLFIPAFCCEKQISRVLNKLVPHQSLFRTILLVDNRSTDGTVAAAIKTTEQLGLGQVVVVQNRENYSLGGSHKVAFQYALQHGFEQVVVLHGDDQADINDLVCLIQQGEHFQYDCLLGARFHPAARLVGYSRFRRWGNLILNHICSWICHAPVLDMGSGLNMYSLRFLQDQSYLKFPNDLTFNIYLLYHAYFSGFKLLFFPISWREEDQISNARVFKQMLKIVGLSLQTAIDRQQLYVARAAPSYFFDQLYPAANN